MDPVRSCGSSERGIFIRCFALVDFLLDADNESEAQAPLEAELLTGQASYLPAKARARQVVSGTNIYLLTNRVCRCRSFRRWQAGF